MSVILPPSEFRGTPNTSVAGRIVIRRGPFNLNRREQAPTQSVSKGGKGKHGKRSASSEGNSKTEIHVLGGTDASEVLFGEAWAENASTLAREVELGKLYIISGARYVAKAPEYSTSRLMYYLRFEGRFGTQIKISEWTENPRADIPLHHPLTDIAKLHRVSPRMQVCIAGVVTHQPGTVSRNI